MSFVKIDPNTQKTAFKYKFILLYPMLRIIFDTNIYSFIAKDNNGKEIAIRIKNNKDLRIYGYRLIKDEIKEIPKGLKHDGQRLRTYLINLYFDLIKEQYPELPRIKKLAEVYYTEFKKLGGKRSFHDLGVDFEIVACATIHNLDLVVSNDNKTLRGAISLNAYKNVNLRNKLKTPNFYNLEDLKKVIGMSS